MYSNKFTIPRLIFAEGAFHCLPAEAAPFGRRATVCVSASITRCGIAEDAMRMLRSASVTCALYTCPTGEPTAEVFDDCAKFIANHNSQMVISIGGGSVIDVGKGAAALAVNPGGAEAYIEGRGKKTISIRPLPFLALPTTSGTGSEMTKNSVVIKSGDYKNSIRSDMMLARTAIVDPALTLSVPRSITASSGTDALCQLIESYTSQSSSPFTDGIAIQHIRPAMEALSRLADEPRNLEARSAISLAATMSGICLANAGLGLAHGISAALGAIVGVPHGIGCGILMPHVALFNAKKGAAKYIDIAGQLGGHYDRAEDAGEYVAEQLFRLNEKLGITADLKAYRINSDELMRISMLAVASSSAKKNPVEFTGEDILNMLRPLI